MSPCRNFNLNNFQQCFRILRTLSSSASLPPVMFWNDAKATTDSDKAQLSNKYFSSVFTHKSPFFASGTFHCSELFLEDFEFSCDEIEYLLRSCEDSTASGSDNIPSFVLHRCSKILAPAVLMFFNSIVSSRIWPSIWKISYVTPLHKAGSTSCIANYRPISILPKLSLIFEKLLFAFLYKRVRKQIVRQQHGFMVCRSTTTQLLSYLDLVYRNRDSNTPCVTIYFDVRKAFDSVPHHILLSKLQTFGLGSCLVELLDSYLAQRVQCVKVNNCISEPVPVTSGVPQGSVLGPLLFIMFVNDISTSLIHCEHFLYYDDLKIFSTCGQIDIQKDLDNISVWALDNGLCFHPEKSCIMGFGYPAKFFLGNTQLPTVESVLDLGITITSDLKWETHINLRLSKCLKIFNFLRRSVPFGVSIARKKLLYQSLVLSVLMYGSPVWCATIESFRKLELFQKRVVYWINCIRNYHDRLLALNFLPLCFQLQRADLILLWKIWNQKVEIDVQLHLKEGNTRSANTFAVPSTKKFTSDFYFFILTLRSANELIRLGVVNFDDSQPRFKWCLDNYFQTKNLSFKIDYSCSYFIKCFCLYCRR